MQLKVTGLMETALFRKKEVDHYVLMGRGGHFQSQPRLH